MLTHSTRIGGYPLSWAIHRLTEPTAPFPLTAVLAPGAAASPVYGPAAGFKWIWDELACRGCGLGCDLRRRCRRL